MIRVGKMLGSLLPVLVFATMLALMPSAVRAAVVVTGNVTPTDTGTWTSNSVSIGNTNPGAVTVDTSGGATAVVSAGLFVGDGNNGTLSITGTGATWESTLGLIVAFGGSTGTLNVLGGGAMNVDAGQNTTLGWSAGSAGTVTVDNSTFNAGDNLYFGVGTGGTGTLNISNGSTVNVAYGTYIGGQPGTAGSINFGPGGGTLTTGLLVAGPTTLTGTGTINATGIVSDGSLTFNSPGSLIQTVALNAGVNVNLNMSTAANNAALGIGYAGTTGSLTISNGVTIHTPGAYLGYIAGSSGTATVDAATWSTDNNGVAYGYAGNYANFYVGYGGNGVLNIQNGGYVGSAVSGTSQFIIGINTGAGTVTVTGTGSKLQNANSGINTGLVLGMYGGTGTLNILNGANVTTVAATIGENGGDFGVVNLDGAGSTWTSSGSLWVGQLGNGTLHITNGAVLTTNGGSTVYTNIGCNNAALSSGGTGSVTVDGAGSRMGQQRHASIHGRRQRRRCDVDNHQWRPR